MSFCNEIWKTLKMACWSPFRLSHLLPQKKSVLSSKVQINGWNMLTKFIMTQLLRVILYGCIIEEKYHNYSCVLQEMGDDWNTTSIPEPPSIAHAHHAATKLLHQSTCVIPLVLYDATIFRQCFSIPPKALPSLPGFHAALGLPLMDHTSF